MCSSGCLRHLVQTFGVLQLQVSPGALEHHSTRQRPEVSRLVDFRLKRVSSTGHSSLQYVPTRDGRGGLAASRHTLWPLSRSTPSAPSRAAPEAHANVS